MAFMVITGAFADEWKQPEYSGAYQALSTEDTVYIYNTASKLFLTEGNDWGTHATVGTSGLLFTVQKSIVEGSEWDGVTYIIKDSTEIGKAWKKMFITDLGNVYMDASESAADTCFRFVDMGNNTFNIVGADANPTWKGTGDYEGYTIGHYTDYRNSKDDVWTGSGVIYDYNGDNSNYSSGEFNTTWAFVSKTDYTNYLQTLETYNTALELGTLIEKAQTYGVDVKEALNVYENTSSTCNEIKAALETLNQKILAYYENNVTPESPIDLTSMIKNSKCDAVDGWENAINASTWNTQTWIDESWQGFEGTTLNIWGKELYGDVYQQLSGLPNGIYITSLAAFSEKIDGYVYANNNKATVTGASAGNTYTVTTEVTDGTLKFGFGQETTGTNWVALDNATVMYYGSGVEAYRYWLNNLLASAPSFDEVIVQDSLVKVYENILASVNTVETKEEILNIIPSYENILNEIAQNKVAYETLNNTKTSAEELTLSENINSYYSELLSEYAGDYVENIVSDHKVNTATVNSINTTLQNMVDETQNYIWNVDKLAAEILKADSIYNKNNSVCSIDAVVAYETFKSEYENMDYSQKKNDDIIALLNELYTIEFNLQIPATPASDENPVDYTAKISFPSFDNGAEGWINDGFATCGLNTWNSFADGIVIDQSYLNLWNESAARVYQVIEGLPNGAYTFQVSAFADAEGFQVYANDNSADVYAGKNANGSELEYGYIYTVDVIVTDGKLEIGGRISQDATVWAMLDNCKLTYFGTESQIYTAIENLDKNANATIESIYTVSGARVSSLAKGLNIVKMSDQSVQKIFVK